MNSFFPFFSSVKENEIDAVFDYDDGEANEELDMTIKRRHILFKIQYQPKTQKNKRKFIRVGTDEWNENNNMNTQQCSVNTDTDTQANAKHIQ